MERKPTIRFHGRFSGSNEEMGELLVRLLETFGASVDVAKLQLAVDWLDGQAPATFERRIRRMGVRVHGGSASARSRLLHKQINETELADVLGPTADTPPADRQALSRARRALYLAGCRTRKQVLRLTVERLLDTTGISIGIVEAIERRLAEDGLRLPVGQEPLRPASAATTKRQPTKKTPAKKRRASA